jgi:hypothetical protein
VHAALHAAQNVQSLRAKLISGNPLLSSRRIAGGQARTQSPQRVHTLTKRASGNAHGGRSVMRSARRSPRRNCRRLIVAAVT